MCVCVCAYLRIAMCAGLTMPPPADDTEARVCVGVKHPPTDRVMTGLRGSNRLFALSEWSRFKPDALPAGGGRPAGDDAASAASAATAAADCGGSAPGLRTSEAARSISARSAGSPVACTYISTLGTLDPCGPGELWGALIGPIGSPRPGSSGTLSSVDVVRPDLRLRLLCTATGASQELALTVLCILSPTMEWKAGPGPQGSRSWGSLRGGVLSPPSARSDTPWLSCC